ncbi:MAG: oligosaccharide repeat unit polymerase [Pirellulaceae bacterium]|nr:oligosaccharide repeat unit polymerase [Pirellulaceae bacterium]
MIARPRHSVWWLHPAVLFGGAVVTLAIAVGTSDWGFQLYSTRKYLEPWHLAMGLGAWGTFALGVWLAMSTGKQPPRPARQLDDGLVSWFWLAWLLTIAGYGIWLLIGLKNGFSLGTIRDLLQGGDAATADMIKTEIFPTIPGVTTATQFGIAAILLGTWLYCRGRTNLRLPLLLLLAIAAARALIYSERLALIELVVPAFVIVLRLWVLGKPLSSWPRLSLQVLPLVAVPLVIVLFGMFESFRSWQYHMENFDSLAEFTIWRFFGYYTTAHNNGAMSMMLRGPWPIPYSTFSWFWEFPLIENSPFGYQQLVGINPADIHTDALERYGNPELNNDGGLFTPARDFGWIGSGPFWFIYGYLAGKAYRGFLGGSFTGCMFYPMVLLALLELPRLQYLSATRTFPSMMLLFAIMTWLAWKEFRGATGRLTVSAPGNV